jgi:hypothetical protein
MLTLVLALVYVLPASAAVSNPADGNDPKTWEQEGWTCEKVFDGPGSIPWYTITEEPPEGETWVLLVLNAGQPGDGRSKGALTSDRHAIQERRRTT